MVRKQKAKKSDKCVVTVSRTSSWTNADGDSTARQMEATKNHAEPDGTQIVHHGVSGTLPLHMRPNILEIVDQHKRKGKSTVLVFENETRLARGVKVQIEAQEWADREGVELVHASIPDLWQSQDPAKKCMSTILAALSEMDWANKVQMLKSGRENARAKTPRRTLKSSEKVEGRKNFKDRCNMLGIGFPAYLLSVSFDVKGAGHE